MGFYRLWFGGMEEGGGEGRREEGGGIFVLRLLNVSITVGREVVLL